MIPRKDATYLNWVRSLPCSECGGGPVQAHHMKGDFHLSGAGMKAPDWFAMPLCADHHRWFHTSPEGWRAVQRRWLIATIILAMREGLLGRPE